MTDRIFAVPAEPASQEVGGVQAGADGSEPPGGVVLRIPNLRARYDRLLAEATAASGDVEPTG